MAEEEVAKHTKKIYKIWNNKEHGLWHKTKDFLIEIFIIVFLLAFMLIMITDCHKKKNDTSKRIDRTWR